MTGALTVRRAGATVWCTLDRPPLNLLEPGLIRTLRETFEALAADRATRIAIVTGQGRAFTAGMDVAVLRDLDPARARALIPGLHDAIAARHAGPFPVPAARVRTAAEALAARVLACGPDAIRLQKGLIVRWREMDLVSAVRLGIDAFAAAYATAEPREGMSAYLEKRPPSWGRRP